MKGSAAAVAVPALTETQFLAQVIDLARLFGWRVAHFRAAWTGRGWRTPVQGDGVGFPDLVLCGKGRVVVAELKTGKGRLTGAQLEWLASFEAAGIPTFVWRPEDFDAIAAELGAGT